MNPQTYTDVPTWSPVLHTLAPDGQGDTLVLGTFGHKPRAERAATLQLIAHLHPDMGVQSDFDDIEEALGIMTLDDLMFHAGPDGETEEGVLTFLTLAQQGDWTGALATFAARRLTLQTGASVDIEEFTVEMPC